MTTDTNVTNLLFLLSLAPLGTGCIITTSDDDGSNDDAADTDNNATTAATSETGDPPSDTTGAATDDGATVGTAVATTGLDTGSGDGPATGDTTEGSNPGELCMTYADHLSYDCIGDAKAYDSYYYLCNARYDVALEAGADCLTAVEDVTACLSTVDCKEWFADEACLKEIAAVQKACPAD
ncbi:MAG: hypothetical protein AAF799_43000 [Myxococcota bacterium]